MAESAIAQFERTLALIPYILQNQGIAMEELATKFDTTTAQIEKDLNLLFVCGLPGYSHLELLDINFESGHVFVQEGQNLQLPNRFTPLQIAKIVVALNIIKSSAIFGKEENMIIDNLLKKLSVNPNAIEIRKTGEISGEIANLLDSVMAAINQEFDLSFTYLNQVRDLKQSKQIRPLRIYRVNQFFYCEGVDRVDNEVKTFRLDRMQSTKPAPVDSPPAGNPATDLQLTSQFEELVSGLVWLGGSARSLPYDHPTLGLTQVTESDGGFIYRFINLRKDWLLRTSFIYPGHFKVVEPAIINETVREIAHRAL
jgi:proteasome accessory factor C